MNFVLASLAPPDQDENDDPLEDPGSCPRAARPPDRDPKALDDLGAVTTELSATRGRKEAQRILTDLLEEIHELPDALASQPVN